MYVETKVKMGVKPLITSNRSIGSQGDFLEKVNLPEFYDGKRRRQAFFDPSEK
jgi:hypothetical protein